MFGEVEKGRATRLEENGNEPRAPRGKPRTLGSVLVRETSRQF